MTSTKTSSSSSSVVVPSSGAAMLNIVTAIALWLGLSCGGFIYLLLTQNENVVDTSNIKWGLVVSLLFFNNLNIIIAFCEICLGKYIMLIKEDYRKMKDKYCANDNEIQAAIDYLLLPLPWDRLFDGRLWCRMWSTYSLYDPSYQNHETFGFFIDVGNGWSTIPPCVLMNIAIATGSQYCSPLWVGCVCLASYWQILYGTIIYFLSYMWNKRYQGKRLREVIGFVGVSNGIWLVFPLAGIYSCVVMLDTKDFSVFGHY